MPSKVQNYEAPKQAETSSALRAKLARDKFRTFFLFEAVSTFVSSLSTECLNSFRSFSSRSIFDFRSSSSSWKTSFAANFSINVLVQEEFASQAHVETRRDHQNHETSYILYDVHTAYVFVAQLLFCPVHVEQRQQFRVESPPGPVANSHELLHVALNARDSQVLKL